MRQTQSVSVQILFIPVLKEFMKLLEGVRFSSS
jgi:hypothetical protein